MSEIAVLNIADHFIDLGADQRARTLPVTDSFWQDLVSGRLGTPHRLVSMVAFERDWKQWERHPEGEELALLLAGHVILRLELEDGVSEVELFDEGQYVLVPKGVWHTARVRQPSRMLFITPGGEGEHRPV